MLCGLTYTWSSQATIALIDIVVEQLCESRQAEPERHVSDLGIGPSLHDDPGRRHTSQPSATFQEDTVGEAIGQEFSKALVLYSGPRLPEETIRVTAVPASHRRRCDPLCRCQCHLMSRVTTPRWLRRFVGVLFFSYASTPILGKRSCNFPDCRGLAISSMQLQYYFPPWVLSRCLSFSTTWDNLTATGMNLSFRLPKLISSADCSLQAIASDGKDKVRNLIDSGQLSPFTIEPDGTSLLHVSLTRKP